MFFLRRSLIGVLLMALSLAGLSWAGTAVYHAVAVMLAVAPGGPPNREVVLAVNATKVVSGPEAPVLEAFGEIRSRRTLDVRASVSGRIVRVAPNFVEGGQVAAGEVLVEVDPAPARAERAVAQADLTEAEADLRDAQGGVALAEDDLAAAQEQYGLRGQALSRQQDLQTRGVGSAAAVETAALDASGARQSVVSRRQALAQAEVAVDQALARRDRAQIALSEADRKLADTVIRAGFSGTLSGVTLVEGGLVAVNEQLAQLVDPAAMEVAFRLSTAQYARLLNARGKLRDAPVEVLLDVAGVDLSAAGRIERESAMVGTGLTGREIFARLDAAPGFRPGDVVTVQVREAVQDQVARLPARAVDAAGNVLVIGADMRLSEVAVSLLRHQGDQVLVRAPDLEGQSVVSERTPLLGAGIKVRLLDAGPDGAAGAGPEAEGAMISLTPERRQALIDFVQGNTQMPTEARARVLAQLAQDQVPARVVRSLEDRMGS